MGDIYTQKHAHNAGERWEGITATLLGISTSALKKR